MERNNIGGKLPLKPLVQPPIKNDYNPALLLICIVNILCILFYLGMCLTSIIRVKYGKQRRNTQRNTRETSNRDGYERKNESTAAVESDYHAAC